MYQESLYILFLDSLRIFRVRIKFIEYQNLKFLLITWLEPYFALSTISHFFLLLILYIQLESVALCMQSWRKVGVRREKSLKGTIYQIYGVVDGILESKTYGDNDVADGSH